MTLRITSRYGGDVPLDVAIRIHDYLQSLDEIRWHEVDEPVCADEVLLAEIADAE